MSENKKKIDRRSQKNNAREKYGALLDIDYMIQNVKNKKKITIEQLIELRGKVSKL